MPIMNSDIVSSPSNRRPVRKSIGFRMDQGTDSDATLMELIEVDDEEERRQRLNQQILERQVRSFNSPVLTPSSAANRRKSMTAGTSGMSNEQIAEHYATCIKLSAENKISLKNAFNLHLIDYLSDVLKERKGQQTNFQMAGTTLDASAKIYAYRVDIVHHDTYKVVGGLGRSSKQAEKQPCAVDEEEGDEVNGAPVDDDAAATPRKRKKRAWKGRTIEQNVKNLDIARVEVAQDVDPLFQKVCMLYDEGRSSGLLCNTLHVADDRGDLLLHSYIERQGASAVDLNSQSTAISAEKIDQLMGFLDRQQQSVVLCPSIVDFEFNKEVNAESSFVAAFNQSLTEALEAEANFSPDEDAELADNISEFGDLRQRQDDVAGALFPDNDVRLGDEGDDEVASEMEGAAQEARFRTRNFPTIEAIANMMAKNPQEYSYLDPNMLKKFTGPEFWKNGRRLFNKRRRSPRKGAAKRRKVPLELEFVGDVQNEAHAVDPGLLRYEEILTAELEGVQPDFTGIPATGKASTTLSRATLEKYSTSETTIDQDLVHYDPQNLAREFLKPSFELRLLTEPGTSEALEAVEVNVPDYNFDNAHDESNFVAANMADISDDVPLLSPGESFNEGWNELPFGSEGEDIQPFTDEQGVPFDGGLVQEPNKVEKVNIDYAKQAKRVDVRRLKHIMWKLLTKDQPANIDGTNVTNITQLLGRHSFEDLCTKVPRYLPPLMAKDLSVPILFVCFLHMCNEKILHLDGHDNMEDFMIEQGKDSEN